LNALYGLKSVVEAYRNPRPETASERS